VARRRHRLHTACDGKLCLSDADSAPAVERTLPTGASSEGLQAAERHGRRSRDGTMRTIAPELTSRRTGNDRAVPALGVVSTPVPGSPAHLDQLIEQIVATAPPFTPEQRRRLAELLSVTPGLSSSKSSRPGQAA
jgi:hypothetical protein